MSTNKRELTKEELQSIKIQKDGYEKELVKFNRMLKAVEAYKRLSSNEDFILLFEDIYFKEEALRTVMLLSEKSLMTEDKRMKLNDMLISTATLNDWLNGLSSSESLFRQNITTLSENISEINDALSNGYVIVNTEHVTPPEGE